MQPHHVKYAVGAQHQNVARLRVEHRHKHKHSKLKETGRFRELQKETWNSQQLARRSRTTQKRSDRTCCNKSILV